MIFGELGANDDVTFGEVNVAPLQQLQFIRTDSREQAERMIRKQIRFCRHVHQPPRLFER